MPSYSVLDESSDSSEDSGYDAVTKNPNGKRKVVASENHHRNKFKCLNDRSEQVTIKNDDSEHETFKNFRNGKNRGKRGSDSLSSSDETEHKFKKSKPRRSNKRSREVAVGDFVADDDDQTDQQMKRRISSFGDKDQKLHSACKKNDYDVVKKLLDDGADVNSVCHVTGNSPLHYVTDVKLAQLLVIRGCKTDVVNGSGLTACQLAANLVSSMKRIVKVLKGVDEKGIKNGRKKNKRRKMKDDGNKEEQEIQNDGKPRKQHLAHKNKQDRKTHLQQTRATARQNKTRAGKLPTFAGSSSGSSSGFGKFFKV